MDKCDNFGCDLKCSRCEPRPYNRLDKEISKKICYTELMAAAPLCMYSVCPKPINLPGVNYNKNTERSAYDNMYGYEK